MNILLPEGQYSQYSFKLKQQLKLKQDEKITNIYSPIIITTDNGADQVKKNKRN